LALGVNAYGGELTNAGVADAHGLVATAPAEVGLG
jgi:alanine dehydrogenase